MHDHTIDIIQKSSSGDGMHRMKTERRATETWGYQILPTLYSTYQKVHCLWLNASSSSQSLFNVFLLHFIYCGFFGFAQLMRVHSDIGTVLHVLIIASVTRCSCKMIALRLHPPQNHFSTQLLYFCFH